VAVKEDITERKFMEAQLSHAQKMESIGELAAGIAHEINTPTQYIGDNLRFLGDAFADASRMLKAYDTAVRSASSGGYADWERFEPLAELKKELDIDYLIHEVPQSIAQALEGVTRVGDIVGAMKQFAHPGSAEKTLENLNAAIESTVIVARNEWTYVATLDLDLDLDPELSLVSCLIDKITQVVLNMSVIRSWSSSIQGSP
jgi:signal transduction histidine kinase